MTNRGTVYTEIEMFHPIRGYEFSYQSAKYDGIILPAHRHNFCEFVYIFSGTGTHTIEGSKRIMSAGDLYILNEGVMHEMEGTKDLQFLNVMYRRDGMFRFSRDIRKLPAFHTLFEIPPSYYNRADESIAYPGYVSFSNGGKERLESLFARIERELDSQLPGFETEVLALFMQTIVHICRTFESSAEWNRNVSRAAAQTAAYIEANFSSKITVGKLCAAAGVQKSALYEQFQRFYGSTPFEYLTAIRLQKAASYLQGGNDPIKQIAPRCGFEDVNYFTRMFRKHYRLPPGRFRRER
ncbi:MAG: helix-turn-helix domain-containing protein [Spirochaetia bacterium]